MKTRRIQRVWAVVTVLASEISFRAASPREAAGPSTSPGAVLRASAEALPPAPGAARPPASAPFEPLRSSPSPTGSAP